MMEVIAGRRLRKTLIMFAERRKKGIAFSLLEVMERLRSLATKQENESMIVVRWSMIVFVAIVPSL